LILIKAAKNSYRQKGRVKSAKKLALDYYLRSRLGEKGLWSKLYKDGPVGRRVYDAIVKHVGALSERCGYCQDKIFHPSNSSVDHILPASVYPQFTFIEKNLVRVCVTCNMLKLAEDFYVANAVVGSGYMKYAGCWSCYHPRHHLFSDHCERLVVQTNTLNFRAYFAKTPEGAVICHKLLSRVSEFEMKAFANPGVALAVSKLSAAAHAAGHSPTPAIAKLVRLLIENV